MRSIRLVITLALLTIANPALRAAGRAWTSSGPGAATAAAVDIADARTVWTAVPASTGVTEIFQSDDGATTWRPVGTVPLSWVTRFSPGLSGILYAAGYETVNGDFPVSLPAIAKSTDRGATWRVVYTSGFCDVVPVLEVDPRDPSVAFAADDISCHGFGGTLLRTTDGGAAWSSISPSFPPGVFPDVSGFALAPSDPSVLYLVQGGGWRSDDGGESWTAIPSPGGFLAVDPASSRLIYEADYVNGGVFRSDDGGMTWAPSGLTGRAGILQVLTDPFVPDSVFARTWTDIFASFDRGVTWRTLPALGRTINDLSVAGGRVSVATDDGVFVFHDVRATAVPATDPARISGAGWTTGGPPLVSSGEVAGVATDPLRRNVVYASDGSGFFESDDAGSHWTSLSATPLTSVLAVDASSSALAYAGAPGGGIVRSIDRGRDWAAADDGLTCPAISDLAVSSSSPNVLYAAAENPSHTEQQCGGVFRSDDSGEHWRSLGDSMVAGIAVDPSNSDVAYVTSSYPSASLARTEDGGTTWSTLPFTPGTSAVAIDPTDPAHLYAVGVPLGAHGAPPPAVCESRDRGDSWEILAVPEGQLFSFLLVDPVNPDVLFASSSGNVALGGVFRSGDGGAHWSPFGLDGEPVAVLAIDAAGRILHASVAGKGIFDRSIGRPTIGSPADGAARIPGLIH